MSDQVAIGSGPSSRARAPKPSGRSLPALPPPRFPVEHWSNRFRTTISTALDSTMMRGVQMVVERALIPDTEDLSRLRDSAAEVLSPSLLENPADFFSFVNEDSKPVDVSRSFLRPLDGGGVWRTKLTTAYESFGFEDEASPSDGIPRIDRWIHDDPPGLGTILTLHGFMMGNPAIDAHAMMAKEWYPRGLDVALMTLPHHSHRAADDASFGGDRFASPHVAQLAEAVREAVYEVRLVARWLREETGKPVGLLGLSLGGYISALCAGVCDDFDFVIPMVAPVCMGDLAWRIFSQTRHGGDDLNEGLSRDELRSAFGLHSPLAHPLQLDPDRVLIIGGRGDRIVPPEHPQALWEHWGHPEIHWFSGSHLAPFGRKRVAQMILRHLRHIDII